MAYVQVLGFDVLLFLLSFFVYTRLGSLLQVTHRLLHGLDVVLAPGEQMLTEVEKRMLQKPKRSSRRNRNKPTKEAESFEIPSTILSITPEYPILTLFPNFAELEMLVSTAFFALVIYVVSEVCNVALNFGRQEATSTFLLGMVTLSVVSLVLQIGSSSTSEKSFVFLVGFFSFLISLFFIVGLHPSALDFHFTAGVISFRNSAYTLVDQMKLKDSAGDAVSVPGIQAFLWIFATCMSLIAACFAVILTLPAFRFARFHVECIGSSASLANMSGEDATSSRRQSKFRVGLHHLNFFMPLFIVLCWIPVLTGDMVMKEDLALCSEDALTRDCLGENSTSSMDDPYLLESQWYMIRFYVVLFAVALRLFLFRPILSCFLDSGLVMAQYMGSRGKDFSLDTIKSVLDITARFMCKVTLQMFAPIVMWGAFTLLLQRWAGYSFGIVEFVLPSLTQMTGISFTASESLSTYFNAEPSLLSKSFPKLLAELVPNADPSALREITLFNPFLMRAVISYLLWWTHLVWFLVSSLGYWYYSTQDAVAVIAAGYRIQKKKKN